jgi:hypothetical protein
MITFGAPTFDRISFCGCETKNKGEQMKPIKLFLFAVLCLASCTSSMQASAPTQTPTQTFTPVPTSTQTPSPTPTVIPTPTQIGGGSGKLIFEYYKVAFEKSFPDLKGEVNVFTSNVDGTDLTPIKGI